MRVSIVVPILNEDELPTLVDWLRKLGEEVEVLFVDGGSMDDGPSLVHLAGYGLVTAAAGRARQMNVGARATSADVLVFLHADVRLPPESLQAMRAAMRDPRVVAGRFELVYESRRWPYPWVAWLGNLRSRWTGLATGDQTIFVRRDAFDAVGGYPEIPPTEDVALMRRLKRVGPAGVPASARRWIDAEVPPRGCLVRDHADVDGARALCARCVATGPAPPILGHDPSRRLP